VNSLPKTVTRQRIGAYDCIMYKFVSSGCYYSRAIFEPPPENWRRPPGRPRTTWMKNVHDDPSSLDLGIHEARDLAQNRPLCGLMSLHSLQGWFCHKCILKRGLNGFKPSWRQQVFAAQKPNTLLLLYSARAAVEFGTQCGGLR